MKWSRKTDSVQEVEEEEAFVEGKTRGEKEWERRKKHRLCVCTPPETQITEIHLNAISYL